MEFDSTQILDDPPRRVVYKNAQNKEIGRLRVGTNEFKIVEGFNKIGRSKICQVVLSDVTVSKVHAEIQAGTEATYICDARSANGTTFKGLSLQPFFFYPINHGDVIWFGDTKAVYETKSKPSENNVIPDSPASPDVSILDNPASPDVSLIAGSQQQHGERCTFQEPTVPPERSKTINHSQSTPAKPKYDPKTVNIHEMETQDFSLCPGPQNEFHNLNESQVVSDLADIHNAETQVIKDARPSVSQSSKGLRLQNSSDTVPEESDSIHDAATQLAVPVVKESTHFSSNANDNSDEESIIPNVGSEIIQDSDDENEASNAKEVSKTNIEDSDGSVTDEELEIAPRKRTWELSMRSNNTKQTTSHMETREKGVSPKNEQSVKNTCELDIDLQPTQIVDVPANSKTKPAAEKTETGDQDTDDEIYLMATQVIDTASPTRSSIHAKGKYGSMSPRTKMGAKNVDDDIDLETELTQKYEKSSTSTPSRLQTKGSSASPPAKMMDQISLFDAETQEMNLALETTKTGDQDIEDEIHLLPTQVIDTASPIRSTYGSMGARTTPSAKNAISQTNKKKNYSAADNRCNNNDDRKNDQEMDVDIDQMPTQVLDVVSSTPMQARSKKNHSEEARTAMEIDDESVYDAPTQVVCKTREPDNSKEKNNSSVDLDDSIAKNLGNMFGNESTIARETLEEPMPLLTQNLVDILKPTQNIVDEQSPDPSTVEKVPEETEVQEPKTPKRRKMMTTLLGFASGQPVASSTLRSTSEDQCGVSTDDASSKIPETSAEDDILFGLPEIRLCGTLSNPGSPSSSTSASTIDSPVPKLKKGTKDRKATMELKICSQKSDRANTEDLENFYKKVDAASSAENSPVLPVKYRSVRRKNISVCKRKIEDDDEDESDDADNDSDEDFDYNRLKSMADKLLTSDNTSNICRLSTAGIQPKSTKPSKKTLTILPTQTRPNRRTCKMPENSSSSLTVAESIDESVNENLAQEASASKRLEKSVTLRKPEIKVKGKLPTAHENKNEASPDKAVKSRQFLSKTVGETSAVASKFTRAKARTSLRAKPDLHSSAAINQRPKVIFTGLSDDDYGNLVTKLGGTVLSNPTKATVLVADKIRRTFKFLCAVGRGLQIVSIDWLNRSGEAGSFLDCDEFMLDDSISEAKYKFKLARSLENARKKKLFDGYQIFVTPKVTQPEIRDLKGMVEACGGKVLVRFVRTCGPKTVIISNEEDLAAAKTLLSKTPKSWKVTVQSVEFILTGILRQEINLTEHKLV